MNYIYVILVHNDVTLFKKSLSFIIMLCVYRVTVLVTGHDITKCNKDYNKDFFAHASPVSDMFTASK